ncbi:MAG: hypothetical protein AAFY60_03645, partial [Myxococcota bacterium]
MKLPRHLRAWGPLLDGLSEEVVGVLGAWLPRLDAAFGPSTQMRQTRGEVEGYGGLSRRGPYERLLVSEWALADAVPDEFLRRALAREQSFLELSYLQPQSAEQ